MTTIRSAVVAVVAAAVLAHAPIASAATNIESVIRDLATEAADVVATEQSMLEAIGTGASDEVARREATAELQSVDARGARILRQLERLDVDLTSAIRTTLAPLPEAGSDDPPPQSVVYEAAVEDLMRIAATPSAVTTTPERSNSPAIGLLAVGALSLLALGAAALGNTLRRRPRDDELVAMAWSDGLTGVANRRRLDHDLIVHDGKPHETAVLMVDVDHFKRVNDRFGHHHGDDVLREISRLLSEHVRIDDVVYRFGGEEFCVLLPGVSVVDARRAADRIVEAARRITLPDGSHVTVSVGVSISEDGDVTDAVEIADRAMYEAKQLGRDRAVSASSRDLAGV